MYARYITTPFVRRQASQVYTNTPHIPLRPDTRFLPSKHYEEKKRGLILWPTFFASVKNAFLAEYDA